MAAQEETYTVHWKKTAEGREVEIKVNNTRLKVTDEPEVKVEIDGQLKAKFSVKQQKQKFPDFELLEETVIEGTALTPAQLLPKNCLIFTHNSPVCVDIPTRYGIIHR